MSSSIKGKNKAEVDRKYFAATGLDYISEATGKPVRVEEGEEVLDLRLAALEQEVKDGNIVEVTTALKAENNDNGEEVEK